MTHETFRSETIRISFGTFFYVLFFLTLGSVNVYLFVVAGVRNPWMYLVPVPLVVATLLAVGIGVLRTMFPVRLEPDHLICCDWMNQYVPVSWESITSAKRVPLLGLSYLRLISGESKRPLWFPLNVDGADDLPTLFASYVENSHPILQALRPNR